MEDFIGGGGGRRAKETEHEGNGETKRLKGNRTSKRSTKRKKHEKESARLCTWREGGREGGGAGHNTVIASKTGPETINRGSGWNSLFFLFVVLCSFLTKTQTTRIVTVTV